MKKNKITLLVMFLLLVTILFSIQLISQRQETRRDAYFSTSKLSLSLSKTDLEKNDDFLVTINAEAQTKVHGFQTMICYDKNIELREGDVKDQIAPYIEAGFVDKSILIITKEIDGKNCVKFAFNSVVESKDKWKKETRIVDLKFRAVNSGEGKINIVEDDTMMVGPDSSVVGDHIIKIDYTNKELSYKIEEPKVLGNGLRFKYSFIDVYKETKCSDKWPIVVRVEDKNSNKVEFKNIIGSYVGNKKIGDSELKVFMVNIDLGSSIFNTDLSVFVKGPKHTFVKYGIDKQKVFYNKLNGQLKSFNLEEEKDKFYDFTEYAVLAGDMAGGKQDGIINAEDYSYIKKEVLKQKSFKDGTFLMADLNGDCRLNSVDYITFFKSLTEKEDQLY